MMAKKLLPFPWPRLGLVEQAGYQTQPEGTTADCLNVRNFDSLEQKLRGGRRAGIKKLFTTRPDGSAIQFLGLQRQAVDLSQSASFGTQYADSKEGLGETDLKWSPDGDSLISYGGGIALQGFSTTTGFDDTHSWSYSVSGGLTGDASWSLGALIHISSGASVQVIPFDKVTGFGTAFTDTADFSVKPDSLAIHPTLPIVAIAEGTSIRTFTVDLVNKTLGAATHSLTTSSNLIRKIVWHPSGDALFYWTVQDGTEAYPFDNTAGFGTAYSIPVFDSTTQDVFISPDGKYVALGYDVSRQSDDRTNVGVIADFTVADGFGAVSIDMPNPHLSGGLNDVAWSADMKYVWVAGTGGTWTGAAVSLSVWSAGFGADITLPTLDVLGTDRATASPHPTGTAWVFSVKGDTTHSGVWRFSPAALNPTAIQNKLIAVQDGSVYVSDYPPTALSKAQGGDGVLNTVYPVSGSGAYQKTFFCDGVASHYVYLNYADGTVSDWATDVTAGTLPAGTTDTTLACRFAVTYHGRLVMSGLREDPQNWFMSAAGDPFDWDYSPTTSTSTQAVAGNNANAGKMGDIITALAPFQDDIMIMGGIDSLWIMRGDPAAGGLIDNISRRTGVVGPRAWAFDGEGTLYFFGNSGLYRLPPNGAEPELVSSGRLDKAFSDLDLANGNVGLAYDERLMGVHIFYTTLKERTSPDDHYFWDKRTNSFWRDQYPVKVGPTYTAYFSTPEASQRGLLLGGFDGYIRQFDRDTLNDDGEDIESYVRFTPQSPGDIYAASLVNDIHVVMGKGSGAATFRLYTGDTVEDATANADAGEPRFVKVLPAGGRSTAMRQRIAQASFIPELYHKSDSETWAFEEAGGTVSVMSRIRGKHV